MSVLVFVVLSLASVVFWRQVVATLLAVVVVLVVLAAAVVLRAGGLLDGPGAARSPALSMSIAAPWVATV